MNDGMGGLTSGIMNSVERDAADIVNHVTAVVHQDVYALNGEFVEGYQWVAALDGDTCPICAGYDNAIYDRLPGIEGEGTMMPEQPAHPNCRCMTVPVMRGTRDIHGNGPSYADWFEGQKEERKLDILGPSRYAMYKQGRKVTRFAADGRTLTLEQLRAERLRTTGAARMSGADSGGLRDKGDVEQDRYADTYYESIRNRKKPTDEAIAKGSGFTRGQIADIMEHVFIMEHDLGDGKFGRFDTDYHIAQAWQRLEQGKGTKADIMLLNHELAELTLMRERGCNYKEAHDIVDKKYPWFTMVKLEEGS